MYKSQSFASKILSLRLFFINTKAFAKANASVYFVFSRF